MYEIPQQLVYKERIIFNLTFQQLFYALLFLPIILIIFKTSLPLEIKIFLGLFPLSIAVAFMYLDLFEHLKKWVIWFSLHKITSQKIESYLEIKEIKDNLIHTKKHALAVIKVSPINFDIKPDKEKEALSLGFQKLLNSLDFPIQIIMTTENLDLSDYLTALGSRTKKQDQEFFSTYEQHLRSTINNNGITNRSFFIVIPEKTDISIQLKICEERLHGLSLKTKRLKDKELKDLLKQMFNQEETIYPQLIENTREALKIDDTYYRIVYASGYPRVVETGFLDKIVSAQGDFNLSMHIEPYPLEDTFVMLNRELQKQRADLYAAKLKNQLNSSLEIQYRDTLKTLENLQKGNEKLYHLSLYVMCKAASKKELDLLTKKVESELNALMIIPKHAQFMMLQGLKSCVPLLANQLKMSRNMATKALSAFFPFTSSFFSFDDSGVWFGLNKNKIPIIKDIFKLSNPNGLVLAQSGGGKSYLCKLLITRHLMNDTRVMIIDPQGEYKALVSHFRGQTINLSRDSKTIINPLDLMGHDYIEKRLSLMDLMKIMLGDLSDIQKAFIDKALTQTYERKGITRNPDTWNNEPPILEDLLHVLRTMERRATKLEQTTLNSLANRLEMYVTGVFSFFNQKTNLDFKNKLVSFDIGNMPSQVKPAVMFLVLDYVYMKMKSDLSRKILLIDESWSLLSRTEEAGYIFEIVKTCRKFNLGLLLINQEVEGLLDSKAGKSVLANSAYTILMRQKPAVIDNICKTFHLSNNERTHLLTAGIGEGLLMMEDDHSELKVISSPEEHTLITTNADELQEVRPVNSKNRKVNINIDEHKRFFRRSELSIDEQKFLLSKGYKVATFKRLASNVKEDFFLLPRHNETLIHFFVTYDTAQYLRKKGFKVKTYTTRKPDIVFEKNGKKYAIEIETGSVLTKRENLSEKVKSLNEEYKKRWFFVVTNRNKLQEYKKFGDSIDLRYLKHKLTNLRR